MRMCTIAATFLLCLRFLPLAATGDEKSKPAKTVAGKADDKTTEAIEKASGMVKEWLAENLDDPAYSVVRAYDAKVFSDPKSGKVICTMVRLKIRTKNKLGASELRDEVFRVTDKKVSRMPHDGAEYFFRESMFTGDPADEEEKNAAVGKLMIDIASGKYSDGPFLPRKRGTQEPVLET